MELSRKVDSQLYICFKHTAGKKGPLWIQRGRGEGERDRKRGRAGERKRERER